jgi:hypothetical protein
MMASGPYLWLTGASFARAVGGRRRTAVVPLAGYLDLPRGREAGEIPAQSRYGDHRRMACGSPVAGPAVDALPSRERAGNDAHVRLNHPSFV